jgi:O-succinylbenzoate synthase
VAHFDKPSLAELEAAMRVVALPMRVKFRGVTVREVALFEGPSGWTEWSPFLEYEADEAAAWLAAAIEFGWGQTPPLLRSSVGINATLAAVAPDQISDALSKFGDFNTVKVKVAEPSAAGGSAAGVVGIEADLARIRAVKELYPGVRIRIDANGGFSVQQAIELAKELAIEGIDLDYFEQPVRTIAELAELRVKLSRIGMRIAADESVRKVSDPMAVVHAGAADVLVLKAQPLGGIISALRIIEEAKMPVTISSALETSVGISMGLHLAAAHELANHDAGLGTVALFEEDICDEPLLAQNAELEVRRVQPSEAKLQKFAASEDRRQWWLDRLRASYALI